MRKIGVAVPCYNESGRLKIDSFEKFAASNKNYTFCFVDDSSRDTTISLIEQLKVKLPRNIIILKNYKNLGKAESVRRGILELLKDKDIEFAGYIDADLSAPLEFLNILTSKMESRPELQMAMGSRVKMLGSTVERKALRHYFGRIYATLASIILGLDIYDTQCGAKLFRAEYLNGIFENRFETNWGFDSEIILRLTKRSNAFSTKEAARIINEVPVEEWRDVKGSKINFFGVLSIFLDLIKLCLIRLNKT